MMIQHNTLNSNAEQSVVGISIQHNNSKHWWDRIDSFIEVDKQTGKINILPMGVTSYSASVL